VTLTMPKAVQGLWWVDGARDRVVAFCGGKGHWDEATNSLYLSLWTSWTFEDSTFGRHTGEQMRKMQGRLKIHYEFADSFKTRVKRAYIIPKTSSSSVTHQLLHKQAGTMIPNPFEFQSFNATGLGSSNAFSVRQLYDQNGRETHHVYDFLWNAKGTDPPLKDKLWRYTSSDSDVDFDSFITHHMELALIKVYEMRSFFAYLLQLVITFFEVVALLPPLIAIVNFVILMFLPESLLDKWTNYMIGDYDIKLSRHWWHAAAVFLQAVCIDAAGNLSYLVPGAGEGFDLVWAPIAAVLINSIFHAPFSAAMTFVKEITFLDAIPTATITWIICYLPFIVKGLRANCCRKYRPRVKRGLE